MQELYFLGDLRFEYNKVCRAFSIAPFVAFNFFSAINFIPHHSWLSHSNNSRRIFILVINYSDDAGGLSHSSVSNQS